MEILDYGKSMYGGWYINYLKDGKYSGVGGNTLKEACNKIGISKHDLANVPRRDN